MTTGRQALQKAVVFRQGYGLTKVGPNWFCMTDAESFRKTGSVGKPIFHSQMRLVDPSIGLVVVYLIYKRFVDSPTGRVCIASRKNENRALSIGFNTFCFKLAALIVARITAALVGMFHTLYKPIVTCKGSAQDGLHFG